MGARDRSVVEHERGRAHRDRHLAFEPIDALCECGQQQHLRVARHLAHGQCVEPDTDMVTVARPGLRVHRPIMV